MEKREIWKIVIQTLITILTAIGTSNINKNAYICTELLILLSIFSEVSCL